MVGAIEVRAGPGRGVRLNRSRLSEYSEPYQRLRGFPYRQAPSRPRWSPIVPNDRWADPQDERTPKIPY